VTTEQYAELATVVDESDEVFERDLPGLLAGLEDRETLGQFLFQRGEVFQALSERMSTLDGIDEFAADHPETVDRFLRSTWLAIEVATEFVDEIGALVTETVTVNWEAKDSPVSFHAVTDAGAGRITGGTGLADDPDVTFSGTTDALFSMLNDDDFNATLAFVQNRYDVIGSLETARAFESMMDDVSGAMEALA
jgi:hypothetical protein